MYENVYALSSPSDKDHMRRRLPVKSISFMQRCSVCHLSLLHYLSSPSAIFWTFPIFIVFYPSFFLCSPFAHLFFPSNVFFTASKIASFFLENVYSHCFNTVCKCNQFCSSLFLPERMCIKSSCNYTITHALLKITIKSIVLFVVHSELD